MPSLLLCNLWWLVFIARWYTWISQEHVGHDDERREVAQHPLGIARPAYLRAEVQPQHSRRVEAFGEPGIEAMGGWQLQWQNHQHACKKRQVLLYLWRRGHWLYCFSQREQCTTAQVCFYALLLQSLPIIIGVPMFTFLYLTGAFGISTPSAIELIWIRCLKNAATSLLLWSGIHRSCTWCAAASSSSALPG